MKQQCYKDLSYADSRQYNGKTKRTEITTYTNRVMFVLINNKGKMVNHEDGHLMIFYKRKEAESWLEHNLMTGTWRVIPLKVFITEV